VFGLRHNDFLSEDVRDGAGGLPAPLVTGDELIGDVVQVIANDLRLRANSQNIIADALDQRGFPSGRDGAERVPCVAGDKTELGGRNPKLFFDVRIRLG
jgi:hypothetical protein